MAASRTQAQVHRNRGRLAEAIKAYNAEQECPWHITKTDIIRMQDQAALISVAETASTATEAFKTLKKND